MSHLRNAALAACSALLFAASLAGQAISPATTVRIDAGASTTPFPHFWEKTFGSGRAILSLRESYRNDLEAVKRITDFESVRFHGILMDEVGLYDPHRIVQDPGLAPQAAHDASQYNFMYVDQIYDGLLARGIRPYVELSFMPRKLAEDPKRGFPFFYNPDVSPPKDYALWDDMIRAFAAHLVARYGIDEVSKWKFEVWNEPNLDFWGGSPKQSTYWTLYDHTAQAIKSVSPRLQVGGPSTAQAAWVPDFINHVSESHIPVDFVSTHVYGNDTAHDVFGTDEKIPRDQMVARAVKKVHDQIAASPLPNLPLIFSEYGASYSNEPDVEDSPFMGPWLANTIRQCDGLVDNMSYWSFSDVFEEQGVARTPFYGGFGIIAADSIPKASFNAFAILHRLGDQRIAVDSDSVLATKRADGGLAIALWNYQPPAGTGATYTKPAKLPGEPRTFAIELEHLGSVKSATLLRVDSTHGNSLALFDDMGRPANPTQGQIAALRAAAVLPPPERIPIKNGRVEVTIPSYGLAVLLIQK
ncbi:MAG TPA: hypothetical protein VL986_14635 [Terracidiphilus sp.]|nr:hypothetical protein [Terracidiphilus sp.]